MKNLLALFSILVLSACTKNDATPQDQLPPATTIGANTAGCYINGELLVPKNGSQAIGGSPNYGLTTGAGINFHPPIIGDDYKYFWIKNLKDIGGEDLYIHINNMTQGIGDYIIGQSNNEKYSYGPNNPQIIAKIMSKTYLSSSNSGLIKVTRFDYTNGIYSGIFHCTLYNMENPSEKIQITDGRFDIGVATLNH